MEKTAKIYSFPDSHASKAPTQAPEPVAAVRPVFPSPAEVEELLTIFATQHFEYGFTSPADRFIANLFRIYHKATGECLHKIFWAHYTDRRIRTGLLQAMAHIDYTDIAVHGIVMVQAALAAHTDAEVVECGIRALENWGNRESLQILKIAATYPSYTGWLQNYLQQVIEDLEKELADHATPG